MIQTVFTTFLVLTVAGWVFTPLSLVANDKRAFKCILPMTVFATAFILYISIKHGGL